MKISSIVLTGLVLKSILGAIIFLVCGVNLDSSATASTLKFKKNNIYGLEDLSNFNLKLNHYISNQLEKEILEQESNFSEYINLIDNRFNQIDNKFSQVDNGLSQIETRSQVKVNIVFQSQTNGEQKLLEHLVDSLRKLEFQSFSNDPFDRASIPILPRVDYSNVYKDVYDFDIKLADTSQIKTANRRVLRSTIVTQKHPGTKRVTSYFQGNKNLDYPSFKNQSRSINNTSSSFNTSSSLLVSSQPDLRLASLTSLPLSTNKSEIYQLTNFNVPSTLNTYQKPKYQEDFDKILQKKEQELEKQREQMSKKLARLRQEREKARKKELEKYRKQRQKDLIKAMNEQKKLQQQLQQQFRQYSLQ